MPPSQSPQDLIGRGEALLATGHLADAIALFAEAVALRPADSSGWRGLGKAQLDQGDHQAARISFARALAIVPYDRYAAHMLASLAGAAGRPATGYVSDLFDTYADGFDAHLTGALGYHIPEAIRALLVAYAPLDSLLDLGCGTGLVGAAVDDICATLDGIDIAPKMTRKAHERGIYRHLHTGDILDALAGDARLHGPYDVVTAADVFVYVGALEAVFGAVAAVVKPHGLFVFSVENAVGTAVSLRSTGRFAHPPAYIADLASHHGFSLLTADVRPIRTEHDQPIDGTLYLLSRS